MPQEKGTIAGEYPSVSRMVTRPSLLMLAHETSCDRTTARGLIRALAERYEMPMPKLSFRVKYGRGGVRKGQPTVSLPGQPMENIDRPWGGLRVGLVLHEMAHAIVYWQWWQLRSNSLGYGVGRPMPHGMTFIKVLSSLLDWWESSKEVAA